MVSKCTIYWLILACCSSAFGGFTADLWDEDTRRDELFEFGSMTVYTVEETYELWSPSETNMLSEYDGVFTFGRRFRPDLSGLTNETYAVWTNTYISHFQLGDYISDETPEGWTNDAPYITYDDSTGLYGYTEAYRHAVDADLNAGTLASFTNDPKFVSATTNGAVTWNSTNANLVIVSGQWVYITNETTVTSTKTFRDTVYVTRDEARALELLAAKAERQGQPIDFRPFAIIPRREAEHTSDPLSTGPWYDGAGYFIDWTKALESVKDWLEGQFPTRRSRGPWYLSREFPIYYSRAGCSETNTARVYSSLSGTPWVGSYTGSLFDCSMASVITTQDRVIDEEQGEPDVRDIRYRLLDTLFPPLLTFETMLDSVSNFPCHTTWTTNVYTNHPCIAGGVSEMGSANVCTTPVLEPSYTNTWFDYTPRSYRGQSRASTGEWWLVMTGTNSWTNALPTMDHTDVKTFNHIFLYSTNVWTSRVDVITRTNVFPAAYSTGTVWQGGIDYTNVSESGWATNVRYVVTNEYIAEGFNSDDYLNMSIAKEMFSLLVRKSAPSEAVAEGELKGECREWRSHDWDFPAECDQPAEGDFSPSEVWWGEGYVSLSDPSFFGSRGWCSGIQPSCYQSKVRFGGVWPVPSDEYKTFGPFTGYTTNYVSSVGRWESMVGIKTLVQYFYTEECYGAYHLYSLASYIYWYEENYPSFTYIGVDVEESQEEDFWDTLAYYGAIGFETFANNVYVEGPAPLTFSYTPKSYTEGDVVIPSPSSTNAVITYSSEDFRGDYYRAEDYDQWSPLEQHLLRVIEYDYYWR
jgi:hypothetical protein